MRRAPSIAPETTSLDPEEHVAMAVRAMMAGQRDEALEHCAQALAGDPDNGAAHHLRGGIYAGMKRMDLAIPEMERAVELEADPAPAAFELGMMHLSEGQSARAQQAWKRLEALGAEHPLFLFQRGMLRMSQGEIEACLADLEQGIARNAAYPALNLEMSKVIDRIRRAGGA